MSDGLASKLRLEVLELQRQNRELLAALKAAHAYLENAGPVVLVEQMKAAIDRNAVR